ncbi:hypothetical protein SCANM124S_00255 [Streptomyces canus]
MKEMNAAPIVGSSVSLRKIVDVGIHGTPSGFDGLAGRITPLPDSVGPMTSAMLVGSADPTPPRPDHPTGLQGGSLAAIKAVHKTPPGCRLTTTRAGIAERRRCLIATVAVATTDRQAAAGSTPEAKFLRQVWVQHFHVVDPEMRRRDPKDRPPGTARIPPYDTGCARRRPTRPGLCCGPKRHSRCFGGPPMRRDGSARSASSRLSHHCGPPRSLLAPASPNPTRVCR